MKKAVIIYFGYTQPHINGSVIDSFEYFYTLWGQDKSIKYIFVDASLSVLTFIHDFLKSRYIINEDCLKNVIAVKKTLLMLNKFDKILVTDSQTMMLMKQTLPIQSLEKHILTEFNDPIYYVKDAIFYNEMPDNSFGEVNYYTKMRFDILRKPKKQKNKLYVNMPKYGTGGKSSDKIHFLRKIQETIDLYNLGGYIDKGTGLNSNIFEEFSHYMYIKTLNWTDPRPRMFHECYYFNIPIIYYNKYNIKDGSYQRYYELMENGLENRHLTKDDQIIQNILN